MPRLPQSATSRFIRSLRRLTLPVSPLPMRHLTPAGEMYTSDRASKV